MHKQTGGYIYILTNKNNTVLYTGVTNDLKRRLAEHQSKLNLNLLPQNIIPIN